MMRWLVLLLSGFLLLPDTAFALKISPFKTSMTGGSVVFRVENNSSDPAAIQVSALTWEVSPDGSEMNNDAEEDFVIFPPQLVLKPHESRAVRVQYLGAPEGSREKAYRLVAEQLPVNLQETPAAGSAVRFMLKFKAALYVAPGKVESDVAAESATALPDSRIRVTLVNKGTGHAILRKPELEIIFSDGGRVAVPSEVLSVMEGENIHAGNKRYFDIAPDLAGRRTADIAGAVFSYRPAF